MRKHDQPKGPARFRVWLGFILAIWARGVAAAADDPTAGVEGLTDPIDLAAERIIVWDAPDGRWVVLSGKAAALHGLQGLRASSIVTRITQQTRPEGSVYQAEIYAEGEVRLTSDHDHPGKQGRLTLRTTREVRLKPYAAAGLKTLTAPPEGLAIVDRGGFSAKVDTPAATATQAGDAPGELPADLVASMAAISAKQSTRDEAVVETAATVEQPAGGARRDPAVERAQARGRRDSDPIDPGPADEPPGIELPPIEADPLPDLPDMETDDAPAMTEPLEDDGEDLPPNLQPLPGELETEPAPPLRSDRPGRAAPPMDEEYDEDEDGVPPQDPEAPPPAPGLRAPVMPGSQRVTMIFPRSGRPTDAKALEPSNGVRTVIYRGGLTIVSTNPKFGTIDIEAESAVIWRTPDPEKGQMRIGAQGEQIESPDQPMEVYLEGNVIFRQDANKFAGKADQKTVRAARAYYDFVTDRFVMLDAELDLFAPTLISPMKVKSDRIEQFRSPVMQPDGTMVLGTNPEIRANRATSTGSRFPDPAYRIYNRSIDLTQRTTAATDPTTGKVIQTPDGGDAGPEQVWRYDARSNFFYMGRVPVFYWPRFSGEIDDLEIDRKSVV